MTHMLRLKSNLNDKATLDRRMDGRKDRYRLIIKVAVVVDDV